MNPNPIERLTNGIIKENPTFVLMLGMCPTLGRYNISFEWRWYGSDNSSRINVFEYAYFFIKKFHS